MDRFIFYKASFFVLLFISLPFTVYTQNECDPDDDDTPIGSLSYNGPVCAGTPIVLTFILISDEDDNEYDVTYAIGGQQFQLDDISDGHQETHVLNNSTNAILEVIYNEEDDCIVNSNFVLPITIWSNPTVNTFTSPASCGSSNGSITLSATEGTPPYTYQLVGGSSQTSPTFNNLEAGSYDFIVTDANNCSASTSATVTDQGAPLLSVSSTTPASCGSSNGSITLSATEGTPPYTYQLVGGSSQTSPTFNNLEAGNYDFIVTDANNCSASTSATVTDQGAPLLSVSSTTPASCGSSNGSIMLSTTEGTPPYTYQLVGGSSQTSPTFNNLEAGSYDFIVTDANNCSASTSATITDEGAPLLSVSSTSPASCGSSNGSITLSATEGTPPYTYQLVGGNSQTSPTFNNLEAGSYDFIVTDANNCSASTSATITDEGAPLLSVSSTSPASCGSSNGSITLSATEGTPPYTYQLVGGNSQTSPTFNNLEAGSYDFIVTDANNCSASISALLTDQGAPELNISSIVSPSCGDSNGSISLESTGGEPPYQYRINEEEWQNEAYFDALGQGEYLISVIDQAGCENFLSINLEDASSNLPLAMISLESPTTTICPGEEVILSALLFEDAEANWYSFSDAIFLSNTSSSQTTVWSEEIGLHWIYYSLSTEDCLDYSIDSIQIEIVFNEVVALPDSLFVPFDTAITLEVLSTTETINILNYPEIGTLTISNSQFIYQHTSEDEFLDTIYYEICASICTQNCDTAFIILNYIADDPCDLSNVPDNLLPEGLTLNNDGLNDELEITIIDPRTCPFNNSVSEVIIFNRWGDKVFEQSPYENNWDGRSKGGELLPPGTYYYIIRVRLPGVAPFVRFKNITLFY